MGAKPGRAEMEKGGEEGGDGEGEVKDEGGREIGRGKCNERPKSEERSRRKGDGQGGERERVEEEGSM